MYDVAFLEAHRFVLFVNSKEGTSYSIREHRDERDTHGYVCSDRLMIGSTVEGRSREQRGRERWSWEAMRRRGVIRVILDGILFGGGAIDRMLGGVL